jgi:hypothetical protein
MAAQVSAAPTNTGEICLVDEPENGDVSAAKVLQRYAADVDGLLRDFEGAVRTISERAEAGEMSAADAQQLKLAASRAMIARLETLSAVYDSIAAGLDGSDDGDSSNDDDDRFISPDLLRARLTVRIKDLQQHPTSGD